MTSPNILILMVDQLNGTLFPDGPAPFLHAPNLAALVDALIDLLILSRTTHVNTSHSTFLRMAMIFKATGYFAA